jgi:hypothetical protein
MVVRLQGGFYGGLGWLVFAGVLLGFLLPVEVLGWCGVIAMARDGYGAFGTLVTVGLGGFVLFVGLERSWGWAELAFSDDAIQVTHGIARWPKRSARISRPPPGMPLTAIVDSKAGRGWLVYYLVVADGVRSTPLEIGRQLRVDKARLREVAVDIERWASQGRG